MSLITAALDLYGPREDAETWHQTCVGSKYHTPKPLLVTQVAIGEDAVWLCGTCASNVKVFVSLMGAQDIPLPWAVRREFGSRIRALGMKIWEYEAQHG